MKWKILALIFLNALLSLWIFNRFATEDDIIASLTGQQGTRHTLFQKFQDQSVFNNRIFIKFSSNESPLRAEINPLLAQAGYEPENAFDPQKMLPMEGLIAVLDPTNLQNFLRQINISELSDSYANLLQLPGSSEYAQMLAAEPLQISKLAFGESGPQTQPIKIFSRKAAVNFDKLAPLYDFLVAHHKDIGFIGADFFAYENYKSIKSDIQLCMWLSIPLNLLLFVFFCPNWILLGFLLVGTAMSYIFGLGLLGLFYTNIFSVVFAFTSTFIGFNNEYLVHFSGISPAERRRSFLTLGSAIGTTLIGFIVVLFGHSVVLKQIAIVSIGGMVGFVTLMLVFQDRLSQISFRNMYIPSLKLRAPSLLVAWSLCLLVVFVFTKVSFQTDLHAFRFQSDVLTQQQTQFEAELKKIGLAKYFAVESDVSLNQTYDWLRSQSIASESHPLHKFQNQTQQSLSIQHLKEQYPALVVELQNDLIKRGINLNLNADWVQSLEPVSAESYLDLAKQFTHHAWHAKDGEKTFLFFAADGPPQLEKPVFDMNAKNYYETALNGIQSNLQMLLAIGVAFMFLYLMFLHKRLLKLGYIFLPLALASATLSIYFHHNHIAVNFIHVAGFILVIALALDYSSISLASDYNDKDRVKVLLTGLSAVLSFGILGFARHPVLHDLGITVALGSGVALLASLGLKVESK